MRVTAWLLFNKARRKWDKLGYQREKRIELDFHLAA